jgi:nucleotide-binding universal stress UspA family protein
VSRFRRILVAVDGSEPSRTALQVALDLAEAVGGEVEALGVEGPLPLFAATSGEVEEAVRERAAYVRGVLDEARSAGAARGVAITTTALAGHPAEVIVRHAEERRADLIVVGHKGHFLQDFPLGSTAARVTRHAPCPVLVVR